MPKKKEPARATPALNRQLVDLLEMLPEALVVIDDQATIQYVNAQAAIMVGASKHELLGNTLWQVAPPLVSIALYQAVVTTRDKRQPLQVKYRSPVTQTWLHAHLSPTSAGIVVCFSEDTELTRLQDPFRQSEQRYQDLLESMSDGVVILTPEGLVLDINRHPLADAQVRREEVVGKPFTDFPSWSSAPVAQQQLRAAITQARRGETVRFEARIHPQPGRYRDLALTITSHRDANQQVEYLISVGRDITARKRAEEKLRVLVDAIPQLVWMMHPDGSWEYVNQRWCDYTGMTAEQAQGDSWIQCLHPGDRQSTRDAWQTSLHTGRPYVGEERLRQGATGAYRWFLVRGMPLKDAQGTILQWFGTYTDIEEQKRVEQRLQESRQNWRALAEAVPQLVWTTRPDGQHEYVNQRWYDYTGGTPKQVQSDGLAHLPFLHPDDREGARALWLHALDTGATYEHEERLRNGQTGAYRWFLTRALPVRDETGQIVRWFGTCTDIDEQKRIEESLRQSQDRVSVLMNSSMIGINIIEEEQIVDANDTFLRMTGYSREDLRAGCMNWMHMTPSDYLARTQQAHQELATQQSVTYEKEYVCKDGSRLPVLVCGVVLQPDPFQGIAFVLDNSARKELERRKDDFLSMASHELKTPLTSLKLQTQLLGKHLAKQGISGAAPALSRMEVQVKQLERLIGELLDVSKIQAGRLEYVWETVNLDALLREVAETMQQMSETHTIVVRGTAAGSLVGDKGRLEQVFSNLLSNAIKYSPDVETVEMDVSASAETVTISVRDQGVGIPKEQREKIFERFYRAFDPSQRAVPGLGMGLYIVAEIVKQHGGTITVESEVGKGSTFHVTLPLSRHA